jgi:hypothetical protein
VNVLFTLSLHVRPLAILMSECLEREALGAERSEVLSSVLKKIQVVWNITRCRLVVTETTVNAVPPGCRLLVNS